MPTAVQFAVVGAHVTRANFAKANRTAHELFDCSENFGVTDHAVKFGCGDECVVIGLLVVAIMMPAKRKLLAVSVK